MAVRTPVKKHEIDCFLCFADSIRPININGRKSKKEGFPAKLGAVLDDDSMFNLLIDSSESLVCRNCYRKVEQTYESVLQIRHSVNQYVTVSCVRVKRCSASPLTPKSSHPLQSENVQPVTVSKSRKQLKLVHSPSKLLRKQVSSSVESQTLSSMAIIPEDHCYNTKPMHEATTACDENPLISDLKGLLKDAVSLDENTSDMLQELRKQSSTLTSRTTNFCSVLYKYRDINRLVDNADHFLDEIIEEMIQR